MDVREDAHNASVSFAEEQLLHCLCYVLFAPDLRWVTALDIDACAGVTPPHDWAIMLPVSRRVQPELYTVMAISRYRDALLSLKPRNAPRVYPALLVDINTNAYDILLLPPRRLREDKPRPEDAYYAAALFLHAGICSLKLLLGTVVGGLSSLHRGSMRKTFLLESLLTLAVATLPTPASSNSYSRPRCRPAKFRHLMLQH